MNPIDQVRCRCLHREPVRKRDKRTIEEDVRRVFADVEDKAIREIVERVVEGIRKREN